MIDGLGQVAQIATNMLPKQLAGRLDVRIGNVFLILFGYTFATFFVYILSRSARSNLKSSGSDYPTQTTPVLSTQPSPPASPRSPSSSNSPEQHFNRVFSLNGSSPIILRKAATPPPPYNAGS